MPPICPSVSSVAKTTSVSPALMNFVVGGMQMQFVVGLVHHDRHVEFALGVFHRHAQQRRVAFDADLTDVQERAAHVERVVDVRARGGGRKRRSRQRQTC